MTLVLVRGSGDIGSAVALRLRDAGYAVVIHDRPRPAHPRRGMAFTDAYFERASTLEGVLAKRASSVASLGVMLECGRALPVVEADFAGVLDALKPDALVDARMHKHDTPEAQRGLAPLAIGLGPGFVAGGNADLVVETAWGEALGEVIRAGAARPYEGEPRAVGGHGRERYIYAPVAGTLRTSHAIGAAVREGEEVASIGDTSVHAPFAGILRGLSHDGAEVAVGTKIVEIDASGNPAAAFGVGARPDRIAASVVAAVRQTLGGP